MNGIKGLVQKGATLCLLGSVICAAATVQGFVFNASNKTVSGARVRVVDPFKAEGSVEEFTRTDRDGHFDIHGIAPGKYQVLAYKPEAGYGDTQGAFFAAGITIPEVTVSEPEDVVTVNVNIGEPGGFLNAVIVDEQTKNPIPGANIRLIIEGQPDRWLKSGAGQDGTFTTIIPSMPVVMTVSSPGYKPVVISLTLSPGEHKALTIALRKAAR